MEFYGIFQSVRSRDLSTHFEHQNGLEMKWLYLTQFLSYYKSETADNIFSIYRI